jgi:heme a synthase
VGFSRDQDNREMNRAVSLQSRARRSGLNVLAFVLALSTLGLVFAGGSVTSNDAGLAVPDWPTTFGENMFLYHPRNWVGDVFFEHGHRLLGSVVGMITIAIVVVAQLREPRRWVRVLAWSMLVAVIVQGVMGGLRVTEKSIALAIVHGCLAQLFFCSTVTLNLVTSPTWLAKRPADVSEPSPALKRMLLFMPMIVFAQLIAGAVYRHLGVGFVVHVIGALIVTSAISVVVMWIGGNYAENRLMTRWVRISGGVLVVQLILGMAAYLSTMSYSADRPATFLEWFIPSTHVAMGAVVLAATVSLTVAGHRHSEGASHTKELSPSAGVAVG